MRPFNLSGSCTHRVCPELRHHDFFLENLVPEPVSELIDNAVTEHYTYKTDENHEMRVGISHSGDDSAGKKGYIFRNRETEPA